MSNTTGSSINQSSNPYNLTANSEVSNAPPRDIDELIFEEDKIYFKARLDTFLDWPYQEEEHCNAHELAMAGFYKIYGRRVRCFVCQHETGELLPDSDPWIIHRSTNKSCPLLKMGKRKEPDDYTMNQFLQLLKQRKLHMLQMAFSLSEVNFKKAVKIVNQAPDENRRPK